jgi:hypothetical protein
MPDTAVRSSSTANNAGSTAVSVSAPAGTTAGDLVSIVVSNNLNGVSVTDNNGSTPFTLDSTQDETGAGSRQTIWSRRIIAGDPSTYAFTLGSSQRWTIVAVTFSNPNQGVIYDVTPSSTINANTDPATRTAPSITTLTPKAIHCSIITADGSARSFTATPAGYTVEKNTANNNPCGFADLVITSPGATGTTSWTLNAQDGSIQTSFAIRNFDTLHPASVF